ncbi:hypothetical protein CcaverHIS002_0211680 [Cutaneotrichosporon cavernicola]|uniref:Uncharacterized protein n=1 Tax=Cutaneotrichosporon cavernicola TaxID=279322 RepID=A0AA48IEK6_9TREE|nr:uncharacterized protein CcaverHIS019_0211680 [Cutaneotrichosporon cavernicola]BEI82008.1 hypothetical protein CcaverHIS002_0211680 [Cutaneotrichosporon cavernicola]BEI89806.1 hypothetical protein CcaverHIS019_0211680 [Cutaneotrichosporon cavernicola]BEJ05356.1 hypothetical protein CcaverHIS641_0211730 [Cutaneotrichosporon cavernicola]
MALSTPTPSPDPRIGMWPWVGFLTLALSLAILMTVIGVAWVFGIGPRRLGRDMTDEEHAERRALIADAERVGSQFSRI